MNLNQLHMETKTTWQGEDCKVVKSSTLWTDEATDVKPDVFQLNSVFKQMGFNSRSSCREGVAKLFFKQQLPGIVVFQTSRNVERFCCSFICFMSSILDLDSSNLQIAVAQLDGEAVSCVIVCSQPVLALLGENPIDVILLQWTSIPYTWRPNNFRLREPLTLYEQWS